MDDLFNLLPWHDAELLSISIDRSNPGKNDKVVLTICWPDGVRNQLVFFECFQFDAKLNFGIISQETIKSAIVLKEEEQLNEIRRKWAKLGVELKDLKVFKIETNSTNSSLKIISKGFEKLTNI